MTETIADLGQDGAVEAIQSAVRQVSNYHRHLEDCFVVKALESIEKEGGLKPHELELVRQSENGNVKIFIRKKED